jgi:hypothetical protein
MGLLLRAFLLLAISVSIACAIAPLERAVPQTETSDCCLKVKPADQQQHDDCGKQMPKSKQDRQCCAGCFSGIPMMLTDRVNVLAPKADPEDLFALANVGRPNAKRPPVPPPRA